MVDAYGAITWWGFSPALDLQCEDLSLECRYKGLQITEMGQQSKDSLNILLVGAADLRHILKTLGLRSRHSKKKLQFYVLENNLEVMARQMLLSSIILESKENLGLKEKTENFIELFGNSLIRQQTNQFLQQKTNELIRFVTDPDYLDGKLPFLNLNNLKFKERDQLEAIFKFWRNTEKQHFDICAHWDQRLRQYLKTRYDSRFNVYDWDYSMKLKDKASIINYREYKTWRESGVAFELRDDSSYEVPNRTLASGIIFKKDGEKIAKRGYWGDIINSPLLSFGIESEDKSLFKQTDGIYEKMATNVSEYNITAWIYGLITGDEYSECPFKAADVDEKSSQRSGKGATIDTIIEGDELSLTNEADEAKSAGANDEMNKHKDATKCVPDYVTPEASTLHFLPLNCLADLPRKSKYSNLFDVIFFSNSMVHLLQNDLRPIIADKAKLIIETSNFMLDLKKDHCSEYNKKVQSMAEAIGFQMVGECDAEKDPFMYFTYTQKEPSKTE